MCALTVLCAPSVPQLVGDAVDHAHVTQIRHHQGEDRREEHRTLFQGLFPESQGQNLALSVLHLPYSLNSGRELDAPKLVGDTINHPLDLGDPPLCRVELSRHIHRVFQLRPRLVPDVRTRVRIYVHRSIAYVYLPCIYRTCTYIRTRVRISGTKHIYDRCSACVRMHTLNIDLYTYTYARCGPWECRACVTCSLHPPALSAIGT